jgi:hypothetical protein
MNLQWLQARAGKLEYARLEQGFGVSAKMGVCPPSLLVGSVRHLRDG